MILAAIFLQAADATALPGDWSALAAMPYAEAPVLTPALSSYVASEIAAGRCAIAKPVDGHYVVRLDVATLVAADGTIRRAVPHAIDCPTVEQYTAGLVLGFARGNLALRPGTPPTWYRATITFDWRD